jgi:hypothetical protein
MAIPPIDPTGSAGAARALAAKREMLRRSPQPPAPEALLKQKLAQDERQRAMNERIRTYELAIRQSKHKIAPDRG